MKKNNAAKTSLLFLGIIAIALVVRMFTNEHELFVQSGDSVAPVAGVNCSQSTHC